MRLRHRRNELYLFALITLGGATAIVAQMEPGDARSFAYQGTLEQDGEPATTPHDLQLALFTSQGADPACLAGDPAASSCGVWSELHEAVEMRNGGFSVMVGRGDGDPLTDAVLNHGALYLGVAVRETGSGAAGFTVLGGLNELAAVPWAARAAAAKDYTVSGQLSAGSVSVAGDVLKTGANGQLAVSADKVFRDTGDNWLHLSDGAGSDTYADLAAGQLHAEGNTHAAGGLTVTGDAEVSGKVLRTEYQTSCASGLSGSSFAYCCRINVRNGATVCRVASDTTMSSWKNRPSPFSADTTNGPYSLSCTSWVDGGNYPFCCRTGGNGAAECKYNTNDHINGAWTSAAAPY